MILQQKLKKLAATKKFTTLNPMCIGISHQIIVYQTKKLDFAEAQLQSTNFKEFSPIPNQLLPQTASLTWDILPRLRSSNR